MDKGPLLELPALQLYPRHFIIAGLILLFLYNLHQVEVVKPLRIADQVCTLAAALQEDCEGEENTCEKRTIAAFEKMANACKKRVTFDD